MLKEPIPPCTIYMEGISFYEFSHIAAVRCLKYYTILTYF